MPLSTLGGSAAIDFNQRGDSDQEIPFQVKSMLSA